MLIRFATDSIAALGALSPIERSLAAILFSIDVAALACLRALARREPPAEEAVEFDEAA